MASIYTHIPQWAWHQYTHIYLSGHGINEESEEPVESDEGHIDGMQVKVGAESRKLLWQEISQHSLQESENQKWQGKDGVNATDLVSLDP